MKFSYNWINELVAGLDADAHELSRLITMKTAESDGVERVGEHFAAVRAARVVSAESIPGSKNQSEPHTPRTDHPVRIDRLHRALRHP